MNMTLAGILAYVGLQLVLGYVVSRRIRTEDDYLLAGRKLGYVLATFSIFATWFGAESCIGTAGAAYADGLAGVTADPFGYALCLLVIGAFLAVPLWNMRLTTIADFFRNRFSPGAERLTAIIMVPTSILWAAAQIRAFGQVLAASSDVGVTVAVTIAAAIVIGYTVMGGMLADAISDVVQGVVLIVGLVILGVMVVEDAGGITATVDAVQESGVFRSDENVGLLAVAESWAIPICGSLIAQEVISRVLSSRSPVVARRSSIMASGIYVLVGLIPVSLGLIGFGLLPGLQHEEQILPLLAQQHLSEILYVVFAGAIISSILSTVDSALLAVSALLAHNVVFPVRPQLPDRHKVRVERAFVAAAGVLAFVLALHAEGVYDLVKDASSFGSAGIFTAFMFGMFTRFGDHRNAFAALITGVIVWIMAHYFFEFELSYLLSLGCSILAYAAPLTGKNVQS